MVRAPRLLGGADLDEDEKWRLLDSLYEFKPIIAATVAVSVTCLFAWRQGLQTEAALWMLSSVTVCLLRYVLSKVYFLHSANGSVQKWINVFFVAAGVTGLQWGLGAYVLIHSHDGTLSTAVFGVQIAITGGAAAQRYSFPAATKLQILSATIMIAMFCFYDKLYIIALLIIVYSIYQVSFINALCSLKIKEITSVQQLAEANKTLRKIATTDALTDMANRRSFDHELSRYGARARETGSPLTLLLIDIDHFKFFNDAYGHQLGDRCLALVAAAIKSVVRCPEDHAARFGGEEFALILPDCGFLDSLAIADRLLKAVRLIAVPVTDTQFVHVTVSVGIATLVPDEIIDDAMLILKADHALYRAKENGRNRVC